MRAYVGAPYSGQFGVPLRGDIAGDGLDLRGQQRQMMPSLSVVQVVPSLRRNDAPADSSPPNPIAV